MNRLTRYLVTTALSVPLLALLGGKHARAITVVMYPWAWWAARLLLVRLTGRIKRRIRWPFHAVYRSILFTIWNAETLGRVTMPQQFKGYLRMESLIWFMFCVVVLANMVSGHVAERFN